jgi:hypothetical protein
MSAASAPRFASHSASTSQTKAPAPPRLTLPKTWLRRSPSVTKSSFSQGHDPGRDSAETEWLRRLREDEHGARLGISVCEELGGSAEIARRRLRRVQKQRRQGYRVVRARGDGISRPRGRRCCRAPLALQGRPRDSHGKAVKRRGSRRTTSTRAGPSSDDDPHESDPDLARGAGERPAPLLPL